MNAWLQHDVNFEQPLESFWQDIYQAWLIKIYVPERDQMNYADALALAMERDEASARRLYLDAIGAI